MSLSRNQVIDWLRTIDITGKTVLDVGAGPKEKWARNWTKGEPKAYKTCDIEESFGTHYVFDLNVDLETSKVKLLCNDGSYANENVGDLPVISQIVFCLEVLEHCWNPIVAIKNLSYLAEEVLYISVPFVNPIHDEVDYLRYTDEWFSKTLPMVGFKKVEIKRRVVTSDLLQQFYAEESMRLSRCRAKKGEGYKINDIGYMVEARK